MHWWRDPRRDSGLTPDEQQRADDLAAQVTPLAVLIVLGIMLACMGLLWIAGAW